MRDSDARKTDTETSDATSKETLEDIQKGEKDSDSESKTAPGDDQVPSPDGVDDESRKPDDAGPM